jgi:hypothetical protein
VSAGRTATLLGLAALATGAAGCGGGEDSPSSATVVQAPTTAVEPSTVPTTSTPPVATDTNPTATTGEPVGGGRPGGSTVTDGGGGESGEGGAGDEEAVRVPVALTTAGASLSPSVVTIPAFLAIEVSVTARGGAEKVTISAPGGGTLSVAAGKTASKRLTGLKPGDYPVTTASGGKATLHVIAGGAPGP